MRHTHSLLALCGVVNLLLIVPCADAMPIVPDVVEELAAGDLAATIEEALVETALARGAWTAEFVEVTAAHPDDGGDERGRRTGTLLCRGGTGVVEIRGDRASLVVVTADVFQHRVGDEHVRQSAPSIALLTLPVVIPGEVMLRQLDLPPRGRWHHCERQVAGDEVIYTIETALGRGSRFSRYRLGFVVDDGMRNLRTIALSIYMRDEAGTDRVLSHAELTVESWASLGGGRVPALVRRAAEIREADGRLLGRGANRLELREHRIVEAADAERTIAERFRGHVGTIIRDDRLGIRYESGGRWIEIDGVRHRLERPVEEYSVEELARLIDTLVVPKPDDEGGADTSKLESAGTS